MKPRKTRRLELNKVTISSLNTGQLKRVAGGGTDPVFCDSRADTYCGTCPTDFGTCAASCDCQTSPEECIQTITCPTEPTYIRC